MFWHHSHKDVFPYSFMTDVKTFVLFSFKGNFQTSVTPVLCSNQKITVTKMCTGTFKYSTPLEIKSLFDHKSCRNFNVKMKKFVMEINFINKEVYMSVSTLWLIWHSTCWAYWNETWCEDSLGYNVPIVWVKPHSLINTIMQKTVEVNTLLCEVKWGWYKLNCEPVSEAAPWY